MVDFTLLEKIVNSNTVFNIGKDKKVIYEETGILRDNIEAQIINPESNFVVVTYWWGRGRDNANIARPCMAYYESIISDLKDLAIDYFDVIYKSQRFSIDNPDQVINNYADQLITRPVFKKLITKFTNEYFDGIYWGLTQAERLDVFGEVVGEKSFLNYKNDPKTFYRLIEKLKSKKENETSPIGLLLTQNEFIDTEKTARELIEEFLFNISYEILKLLGGDLLQKYYIYESVEKLKANQNELNKDELLGILNYEKEEFKKIDENILKKLKLKQDFVIKDKYNLIDELRNELNSMMLMGQDIENYDKTYTDMNIFDILNDNMRWESATKFENMIDNWRNACRLNNCNYLSVEYNEFLADGGYQDAINAKPFFIKKALELCPGRAVVYIDGDMFIRKYPWIFETPNIDFMARGWNIDPRASWTLSESITYDPYKFETSGGIMYFSQTPESNELLNQWINITTSPTNVGKADDRLLSVIVNSKSYLLNMNIIQLPVEYLWLSLTYDERMMSLPSHRCSDFESNSKSACLAIANNEWYDAAGGYDWDLTEMSNSIYVEHPECLTSEESAKGAGASSDRTPKHHAFIDDEESTIPVSEKFYEYLFFEKKSDVNEMSSYLNFMNDHVVYLDDGNVKNYELELVDPEDESNNAKPLYVTNYDERYGERNINAENNQEWLLQNGPLVIDELIKLKFPGTDIILVCEELFDNITPIGEKNTAILSSIIQLLLQGYEVIYKPIECGMDTGKGCYLEMLVKKRYGMDLVFFPLPNDSKWRHFLRPPINAKQPIYFNMSSMDSLLIKILKMFSSLDDLSEYLNKGSYQIISRIRIKYCFTVKNMNDIQDYPCLNSIPDIQYMPEEELNSETSQITDTHESPEQSNRISKMYTGFKNRLTRMNGGYKGGSISLDKIQGYEMGQCEMYPQEECNVIDELFTNNELIDEIEEKIGGKKNKKSLKKKKKKNKKSFKK